MTQTVPQLQQALQVVGSDVLYHRESGGTPCPCRTPEGFRDPAWHHVHPDEPECNEQGFLDATVQEFTVKASIQGALTRYFRMAQRPNESELGWIQRDDKLGIFPVLWNGNTLDFRGWSDGGEDYVVYDGDRYTIVTADKFADVDGQPDHHWEVGMRLIKPDRPTNA